MWIKLDDGFATHPKVIAAGAIPALLQVRAICYASQHKTDGFIPASAVPLLLSGLNELGIDIGGVKGMWSHGCQADEIDWAPIMVARGLWEERDGGYEVHDYLDWNISKKDYELFIKQKSKAGKKGMKVRWGKELGKITPVITDVITNDITKPYHTTSTSTSSLLPLNPDQEFEQFWSAYPKKVGKLDAQKAWKKATKKPPLTDVLAAVLRAAHSEQWTKDAGQYIPNPATWLNQGRWADEPIPTKGHANGASIPPFPGPDDPIGRGLWRRTYGDPANPRVRP